MRRIVVCAALLVPAWLVAPAAAPALPAPALSIANPMALKGQTLSFSVSGRAGATVQLVQSTQPAEIDTGAAGLQFYASGTQTTIASGTIPTSGVLSLPVPMAAGAKVGSVYYVQALAQQAGESKLSNAVPYRVESALPVGPRETTALAVTPDGRRAFVGHRRNGIVTIVDAVADKKLTELPITVDASATPHRPVVIAVDPEGRHAFVSNATGTTLTVIHAATGSVAAQLTVPRGNRGIGFDFRSTRRIYVANETTSSVLVFEETQPGSFTARPSIPLRGHAQGPLLVLPDGRIAVGNRTEAEIEIVDPTRPPATATVARTVITGVPYDMAMNGSEILVATFLPPGKKRAEGFNYTLRLDGSSYQVVGKIFTDLGADCRSIVSQPATGGALPFFALACGGSGTVQVGDGQTLALQANLELEPGYPTATPQQIAIVRDPGTGLPKKLYVTDFFRETLRSIDIGPGPSYTPGNALPLAWSKKERIPLSGDLSAVEDGNWFFRSVFSFGGTPMAPNTVTCESCHTEGAANNLILSGKQVLPPWGSATTAPYGWQADAETLQKVVNGALTVHNHTGNPTPKGALTGILNFVGPLLPPPSIYLDVSGKLNPTQLAGKALFEGIAGCTGCHPAPDFIPVNLEDRTIANGIGTDFAPVNIPSLRGVWATGPYLHDGRAITLMDVLTMNPQDAHGVLAAPLTPTQRGQLVEYLKTL